MIVTDICPYNKKKYKIFIDGSYAFMLYRGEMRRYGIEKDAQLSETDYEELMQEVLVKRGRSRALHLLLSMSRTKEQVRSKLSEGGYPPEVIEQVLDYVKAYHYIDDERYTSDYLRTRGTHKSVRQLKAELYRKGISDKIISKTLEEQPVDEREAIYRWMEKKQFDMEHASREEKNRMYQFLARRGFSYQDIQSAFRLYSSRFEQDRIIE